MAPPKADVVHRPLKKGEYTLLFATRDAHKSWSDLLATQRSTVVDAWDFLTRTPLTRTAENYPLKGDLGSITRAGVSHEQWQHKLSGGARLWFYVEGQSVFLVTVHTRHPDATK